MFKVLITKIFPKFDFVDPIKLYDLDDLYAFRSIKWDINDAVGPFLVELIESHEDEKDELVNAHICHSGKAIYNFVKKTIERKAIDIGITQIF